MTMSRETYVRLCCLEARISAADDACADQANLPRTDSDPLAEEIRFLKERLRLLEGDVRWLLSAFERRR